MGPLARGKVLPDWARLAQRSNAVLWMEHWKQSETQDSISARAAQAARGQQSRPPARVTSLGSHGWRAWGVSVTDPPRGYHHPYLP